VARPLESSRLEPRGTEALDSFESAIGVPDIT